MLVDYTRIGSNKGKTPEHNQAKHTKHPQYACYFRNRSPSLRSCTPYEAFLGERPDVSTLRVFGSVAYVLRKDRVKVDGKVDKGRFVGFTDGIKGFRVVMPDGTLLYSRNVTFDETVTRDASTVPWAVQGDSGNIINDPASVTDALAELLAGCMPTDPDACSDASYDSPVNLDPAQPLRASSTTANVPMSFQQAMKSPLAAEWKQACDEELARIIALHV